MTVVQASHRQLTPGPRSAPEAHAYLAAIVESSDDAIIGTTLQGHIISWNRGAQRIFDYAPEEAIGQTIFTLVPPDRQDEVKQLLAKLRRGQRVEHFETVRLARGARAVEVSLTISPIRSAEGAVVGISSIARDITGRRHSEAKLAQQATDLARSHAELDRFASIAAHDLLEPLRTVATFADLLRERIHHDLDEESAEALGFIIEGADRMQALLKDLLTFARITSRARPSEPVDCAEVVENVMKNLRASIQETGAKITVDALPKVLADARQLEQVFQNLIGNALKFCAADEPAIHVSAAEHPGEWVFSIRDNGIGIAAKHFQRIFEIFQRLHTAEEYPGTGVGLSICKKIIDRHQGRIWLESSVGGGSTFYFSIPHLHG